MPQLNNYSTYSKIKKNIFALYATQYRNIVLHCFSVICLSAIIKNRTNSTVKRITNVLDDLKIYFQIENKYPNFKDFKRRVILIAITKINETVYFEIDIKGNKVGRKVDYIDFIVTDLNK